MGTIGWLFRNGTPVAIAEVSKTGEPTMTNVTLTGNFIQGNYPRSYLPSGKRFKISGLNTSEPVRVWNTTKLKCVNWNMVAAVGAIAAVSAAGWTGLGLLISHLFG
jgi:hypothetical protein